MTHPLEARISQLTEEGRALGESLHQSEHQAKTMCEHGFALQGEVVQLRDRSSTLESSVSQQRQSLQDTQAQTLRVYQQRVKLDVTKISSDAGKLLRWILQVETASNALCITGELTRVAFALTDLMGQAEDWAYSIRLTNPTSFATFDELVAAMKLRFLPKHSDFQYRFKSSAQSCRSIGFGYLGVSNPAVAAPSAEEDASVDRFSVSTAAGVRPDALEAVSIERDGLADMLRQSEAHVQMRLPKNNFLERQVEIAARTSVQQDLEFTHRRADLEQEEAVLKARALRLAARQRRAHESTAAPFQVTEQTRDPVNDQLYTPAYVEALIDRHAMELRALLVPR
ncbi:hypothetical protein DYB32_005721 [Aphanomyces invadans]|uniref:Uncharacterized protein n=1 Tax=Aphanomyces invadans TaxID=157072 RepID=A0A418ATR2_9STRA|nr:hypothetical protein DYB32_005721 [Aphanomyces invadans]